MSRPSLSLCVLGRAYPVTYVPNERHAHTQLSMMYTDARVRGEARTQTHGFVHPLFSSWSRLTRRTQASSRKLGVLESGKTLKDIEQSSEGSIPPHNYDHRRRPRASVFRNMMRPVEA